MFRYEGARCAVCGEKLNDGEDIVVCPECGAPQHRDCWKKNGKCGSSDMHGQGVWPFAKETEETVEEEKEEIENVAEEHEELEEGLYSADIYDDDDDSEEETEQDNIGAQGTDGVCPTCFYQNSPDARFCNRCGSPLTKDVRQTIVLDPLGGISPEDEIDGVKMKDLAAVIGQNSIYYIPRFMAYSKKQRKILPNFAAFLFDYVWLFYRKMYLQGFAVLLLEIALTLPQIWALISGGESEILVTANSICLFLTYALRILLMLFVNRMYMNSCLEKTKALRASSADDEEFKQKAQKKGGVLYRLPMILASIYVLSYIVSAIFLLF